MTKPKLFILWVIPIAIIGGALAAWRLGYFIKISEFFAAESVISSNIDTNTIYDKACSVVVNPSDNFASIIHNLIPTQQLKFICFLPGTYTKEINIYNKQNLVLLAPEGEVIIRTNTPKTSATSGTIDIQNSSNILFIGFKIINSYIFTTTSSSATQWSNGVYINGSSKIVFVNSEITTNGKNAIIVNRSQGIQFLATVINCYYFCMAADGAPNARSDIYVKRGSIETNAERIEDHTMIWTSQTNWTFEDVVLKQTTGQGFVSGGVNDADSNNIVVRGATQITGLQSWVARHHNYFALNVWLKGQFPNSIGDFITYQCDSSENDCRDYPDSISNRYHVYREPSAATSILGDINSIGLDGSILGWALNKGTSSARSIVRVSIDAFSGASPFDISTDIYLQNVNDFFGVSGEHGFRFIIPEQYKTDCAPHIAYIYVPKEDSTPNGLQWSPSLFYFCSIQTSVISLSSSASTIRQGETITVSWSGVASPTASDWIGLYQSGSDNTADKTYFYTSNCTLSSGGTPNGSGSCQIIVPIINPGSYEFRFFPANTRELLAVSAITITAPLGTKPGDLDSDNDVDIFDYNRLIGDFGKSGAGLVPDIDSDGDVDIFDYNQLIGNFGR